MEQEKVTRILRLIDGARRVESSGRMRHLGKDLVAENLPRRALIKHVKLAGDRCGLQDDIDLYLAAAGCATLSGLDNTELRGLAGWISQTMDRRATAADSPDAPPAY